jgi:hypothetical protein
LEELGVSFAVATGLLALADLNQFNFENQGSIGRDGVASTALTVSILWCELEFGFLTDCHGGDTHVPALDDLALPDRELEGLLVVERLIEDLTI